MKRFFLVLFLSMMSVVVNAASIISWGANSYNQLSNTPTGTDFTAIVGGEYHSFALKADGSIVFHQALEP